MKKYLRAIAIVFQFLLGITRLYADYLYPITPISFNNSRYILLLHQKITTQQTTIWLWNPLVQELIPILYSRFCPAGIKLLPDDSGFSFIEHGRIYVKRWDSRMPKAIDIYAPIYNIDLIEWLSCDICYFHAKYGDTFGVYAATLSGDVVCLVREKSSDCMYPQIKGDKLFYIERPKQHNYHYTQIKKVTLHLDEISKNFNKFKNFDPAPMINSHSIRSLAQKDNLALICLNMTSSGEEGHVIGYDSLVTDEQKFVDFSVYYIMKDHKQKPIEKLFSFSLPIELLADNSNHRLFESIIPCLPKKFGDVFYYVTYQKIKNRVSCLLKKYDWNSGRIFTLSHYISDKAYDCALLAPIKVAGFVLYGGFVHSALHKQFYSGLPYFYPYNDSYKAHLPTIAP